MNIPSISVLMPVYNAEKYIKAAVESILKQTFADFEFIIINDGSTDGTLAILEQYAQQDKRIRLVNRENKGLVATLNEGLGLANAPLIARMDADDISLEHRFMLQKQYLDKYSDILCVSGSYEVIDEQNRLITRLDVPLESEQISEQLLKGHCPMVHPATMYRKTVIDKIGDYAGEFLHAEDYDLWLRFDEYGKLANLPNLLIQYRYSNSSISSKHTKKQLASAKKACEAAWSRRQIIGGVFEPTGDWRPSKEKSSEYKYLLKLAWWAYNYSQLKTALFYGYKAITLDLWGRSAWVLVACVLGRFLRVKK